MGTSRDSRRELDAQEARKDDVPPPQEILDGRELFQKGPVRTLSVMNIQGNVMKDVKGNEWERVQSRSSKTYDGRSFVPGRYAKRAGEELQYFKEHEPQKLSTDILYIEESGVEWRFSKKGQAQFIVEEDLAA